MESGDGLLKAWRRAVKMRESKAAEEKALLSTFNKAYSRPRIFDIMVLGCWKSVSSGARRLPQQVQCLTSTSQSIRVRLRGERTSQQHQPSNSHRSQQGTYAGAQKERRDNKPSTNLHILAQPRHRPSDALRPPGEGARTQRPRHAFLDHWLWKRDPATAGSESSGKPTNEPNGRRDCGECKSSAPVLYWEEKRREGV